MLRIGQQIVFQPLFMNVSGLVQIELIRSAIDDKFVLDDIVYLQFGQKQQSLLTEKLF